MKMMDRHQLFRLRSLLTKVGIVLLIGIAYALFVRFTGWGIPCVFHLITGKLCPGCGVSRMFLALLELDFARAASHNILVLLLLPFALILFIYKSWRYIKNGDRTMFLAEKIFYITAFVFAVIFFILRNHW